MFKYERDKWEGDRGAKTPYLVTKLKITNKYL